MIKRKNIIKLSIVILSIVVLVTSFILGGKKAQKENIINNLESTGIFLNEGDELNILNDNVVTIINKEKNTYIYKSFDMGNKYYKFSKLEYLNAFIKEKNN